MGPKFGLCQMSEQRRRLCDGVSEAGIRGCVRSGRVVPRRERRRTGSELGGKISALDLSIG